MPIMRRASRLLTTALVIAFAGLALATVSVFTSDAQASAAAVKEKKSKLSKPHAASTKTTGFEHQQCSVQNPCPSRNMY